ncbi:D-ribose pyranase [Thalassobacillus cyri]|uniref:D-ribose pyranase n=1 Tax=Thalassobacillus cyri TaxID=571932 RepID=A0A1H4DJR9_9BACI|nr:D-ribose pyranase [Thalassobacillus cyri]SEA73021.1 D-ribose pyranase [Thalassobacillus cyri]
MKKHGVLNSEIAQVLANLGHTDQVVIADCGLPIPSHIKKIDVALTLGHPSFQEVLEAVTEDMEVEKMTLASEIKEYNSQLNKNIEEQYSSIEKGYISHEQLKQETNHVKAVIRTGENTPYANVILHAGVIF